MEKPKENKSEKETIITLPATRGTPLYKNSEKPLTLEITVKNEKNIGPFVSNAYMIVENIITLIGHLGAVSRNGYVVNIPPHEHYMILNTTDKDFTITFNQDISTHEKIYDPYKFEHEEHKIIKADEFKKEHPVPDGYIDTLEKWYSIKFTYPDKNYIFIRPGLGISLQAHKYREEHWKVLEGRPIIIAQPKVYYYVEPGFEATIPLGALHTVINPSDSEWVLIEEKYAGKFDEKDIARVFNPNHYYD